MWSAIDKSTASLYYAPHARGHHRRQYPIRSALVALDPLVAPTTKLGLIHDLGFS